MEYRDFMALGMLPDATRAPVEYGRDALSEAHDKQLLLNLLFGRFAGDDGPFTPQQAYTPTTVYSPYGAASRADFVVAPALTSAGLFAGRIADTALPPPPSETLPGLGPTDELGIFDEVLDMLGLSGPDGDMDEDEQDAPRPVMDPFAHPTGVSTNPEVPMSAEPARAFFPDDFAAPAVMPPTLVPHAQVNPDIYGWSPRVIAGLADVLGPDITSVSRLGGPFAGYTPDALTERLRELVRRA